VYKNNLHAQFNIREILMIDWQALNAVSTLILGISAAFIAYQQYQLNQSKYKHDLYDKRMKLYIKAKNFLSYVYQTAHDSKTLSTQEVLDTKFHEVVLESEFIFDSNASNILGQLHEFSHYLSAYLNNVDDVIKLDDKFDQIHLKFELAMDECFHPYFELNSSLFIKKQKITAFDDEERTRISGQ